MLADKERLVPSDNLSDFYSKKISVGLTNIYLNWLEIDSNKTIAIQINILLKKIFHQIKSRLRRFKFDSLIKKYDTIEEKLIQLKPFGSEYIQDVDNGKRRKSLLITEDYNKYIRLLEYKEILIWDCLDYLGLIGQVDIKSKRLR